MDKETFGSISQYKMLDFLTEKLLYWMINVKNIYQQLYKILIILLKNPKQSLILNLKVTY